MNFTLTLETDNASALATIETVIAATDFLFFTLIDWKSLPAYDGLEKSLGIFGETLITLGRFLTTKTGHPDHDFNLYPIKQDRSA